MTEEISNQGKSSPVAEKLNAFFATNQPHARRIFHGRGQRYPGLEHLCIDWFGPLVLISAFAAIEDEGLLLEQILGADKHDQITAVMIQRRYEKGAPAEFLSGSCEEQLIVAEDGLRYEVHPGRRQNVGLFMDMRLVRQWLAKNSSQRNVLNLFAYTCSLSVAALAGGASAVTNVDVSKTSIAWGQRNHELNGQSLRQVKAIPHNLFTSWGRIKQFGRYDLVIIDPPTRQRGSFEADKNYAAVVKRLGSLCNPGAEIIACLNSPFLPVSFLTDLFAAHCPGASFVEMMPAAPEYKDAQPERGLKICRYQFA